MFAVPKYSQVLDALRRERNVEGLFQHNLVAIDAKKKVATFKNLADGAKGATVERDFGFLHVVPPQKPWDWVAKSKIGTSRYTALQHIIRSGFVLSMKSTNIPLCVKLIQLAGWTSTSPLPSTTSTRTSSP
jgi:NADPH-dependent 2,4-dienoyl-CoA reductase/sulfur reductase-like enzyme